ncbi:hypothetical protein [Methanosarcina barkeri]|uniref:hypothetical protein n=1 Tax=Methanosarcina barkeri TaxID=2208 RepID=UPI001FB1C8FC|nr:hypothetical protein [Methanosarcina barkeri]
MKELYGIEDNENSNYYPAPNNSPDSRCPPASKKYTSDYYQQAEVQKVIFQKNRFYSLNSIYQKNGLQTAIQELTISKQNCNKIKNPRNQKLLYR